MFKLLRYFLITSLIAFTIITIVLAIFYNQTARNDLVKFEEKSNITLTKAFANSLWHQFEDLIHSDITEMTADELRTHPEVQSFHQAVLAQMKGLSVLKMKIYNLDGLTVYSSEFEQIGESKYDNPGFQAGLSGKTASELVYRNSFNAFEGVIANRDIVESYIPIRHGNDPNSPVEAVAEVYDDVTPFLKDIAVTRRKLILGIVPLITLLFLALFFIILRADKIIRRQYNNLEYANTELADKSEKLNQLNTELSDFSLTLEQKVIERTQELKDSQARLLASEKLASIGKLTAGLAHEINTPLAASRNQILQAKNLTDEYEQSIGLIEVTEDDHREIAKELSSSIKNADSSLERLGEFVRRMRSHSRTAGTSIEFDPYKVAEDSFAMLEHRARKANVELRLESSQTELNLYGDPARFNQVISNLLVNAMDASEERSGGGALVKLHFEKQDDQIAMLVEDNGHGIPKDILPKIFEPMFTTKEIGKGTGLGLSIIHNIITGNFSGGIDVSTIEGQGSTFKLTLPIAVKQGLLSN